jgi:hypothetical protein
VATATNLTPSINPSSLTAVVTGLDITTTSDVDYYTFTAPAGASGTLTVTAQSSGLSLLAPALTVYAADGTTVLGSAAGTGNLGSTLTVTLSGVASGQRFYVKVAGANPTAFGTGAYALTLNFGTGPAPVVAPPVTTLSNGGVIHSAGTTNIDDDDDGGTAVPAVHASAPAVVPATAASAFGGATVVQALAASAPAATLPGGTAVQTAQALPAAVSVVPGLANSATASLPLSFRVGTPGPVAITVDELPDVGRPAESTATPAATDGDSPAAPAGVPDAAPSASDVQFPALEALGSRPCDYLFAQEGAAAEPAPVLDGGGLSARQGALLFAAAAVTWAARPALPKRQDDTRPAPALRAGR